MTVGLVLDQADLQVESLADLSLDELLSIRRDSKSYTEGHGGDRGTQRVGERDA
jgi:hypothetical protein